MQSTPKVFLAGHLASLVVAITLIAATSSFGAPQTAGAGEVPVVKADAGPCSADFVVSDAAGKGIYDAKVEIQIRYRFGGFHRIDAKVGTNVDGKARVEGLPEQIKNTAEFTVTHGELSKSVAYDPQADCHARHEVSLIGK
jgi:hypothetical protein